MNMTNLIGGTFVFVGFAGMLLGAAMVPSSAPVWGDVGGLIAYNCFIIGKGTSSESCNAAHACPLERPSCLQQWTDPSNKSIGTTWCECM
ncbi:MAG TPA: hypothetical protein PKD64_17970 [Pirellulaceae bacterium]|nr:hypothetical protein [Pirellulaceae bacterium]HMO94076.1 hypothetical protein [Pirellulaceae bacterium]HMP71149.1 hypothetical protein [Pirellulaceae bacterium]